MNKRALSPGTLVHNRYRIEKVLGEGGFGVTYKVRDNKENRISALKEYFPMEIAYRKPGTMTVIPTVGSESTYRRFQKDFINEAQLIYNFRNHPNIVSVYHLFEENNTAYYAMEYIEGSDLSNILAGKGSRMRWDELRPIVAQVITALRQAHKKGVIHCDISPDNIYVMRSGQVKLIDFGAAKRTMNTQASVVLLKRSYAPLEQMSANGKIGPWTDIFALSVTIFQAVTGKLPPPASDRIQCDNTVWPTAQGFREPFRGWEEALRRGMALHYDHRFQTVEDFWQALSGGQKVTDSHITLTQPVALVGTQGKYTGSRLTIREECMVGVDTGRCQITYPIGTPGVSRIHLRIWPQNGKLMVMDMGSRYGTWLSGQKMVIGLAYAVDAGATLFFGDNQEFRAVEASGTQYNHTAAGKYYGG